MFEKFFLLFSIGDLVRNKSIQNFIFLAIIQSSNMLISLISMPILIDSIGVDQFGLVNLAFSVIIILNVVVVFGYSLAGPREVALAGQDKNALSHILSNIFSAKILLATLCSIGILIAIFGFNLFQSYQEILIFSVLLLFSEATLPLWFFQGLEKMKLVSIANIFSKLLYLTGIVLFIQSPEQAKWVNFVLGFSGLAINILLLGYIQAFLGIRFYRPEFFAIWNNLKQNILLFFSSLASYISTNGGLIVLSFFANSTTLGMFSLAEKITLILRIFPALVVQAVYANATKLYHGHREQFFKYVLRISFWAVLLGFLISITTFLLAPFIIQILSKKELPEAVSFLKILAFVPTLACLNIVNLLLFLVKDQKSLIFRSSWMLCIYMILSSSILTHFFGGLGLAFGLVSGELVVFGICLVLNFIYNKSDMIQMLKIFKKT
jgi:PST family polysaccharide transporter